jgi:hypothetical protein
MSSKKYLLGTRACSCASRGAGIYDEHAIAEGRQQVCHCINKEFGTPRTEYMHIEVKYLLVWEFIENDLIKVEFIRNEEQMGDILTKPLDRVKFLEVHDKISLIDVDGHNKA